MKQSSNIKLVAGLKDEHFKTAAHLYDEAFGKKFRAAISSRTDRIALFEKTFVGEFALSASDADNLVGLAGLQTPDGSLTGGINARQLTSHLGILRGLWAIAIFSFYERTAKVGELVMDGIAVQKSHRGQGIGTMLLDEVIEYAKKNGFSTIRLDVIDTNPSARRLYERSGFVAERTEKFGYLRWLIGFGAATTMEFQIASNHLEKLQQQQ